MTLNYPNLPNGMYNVCLVSLEERFAITGQRYIQAKYQLIDYELPLTVNMFDQPNSVLNYFFQSLEAFLGAPLTEDKLVAVSGTAYLSYAMNYPQLSQHRWIKSFPTQKLKGGI